MLYISHWMARVDLAVMDRPSSALYEAARDFLIKQIDAPPGDAFAVTQRHVDV